MPGHPVAWALLRSYRCPVAESRKCFVASCSKDADLVAWGGVGFKDGPNGWIRAPLCREHFDSLKRVAGDALRLDPFQADPPEDMEP